MDTTKQTRCLLYVPWWVYGFAFLLALQHWLTPYDDTDDKAKRERSGMVLYTDHGTGCQYLRGGLLGGMTARLDGEGRHVGCR